MKTSLKIPSMTAGWNLDAWQYLPDHPLNGSQALPVVVMAHGLTATKKMGLDVYAQAFVSQGYACVVFDYRTWGDSDGVPRSVVDHESQQDDYRTVVRWVRQQKSFDHQKVVIWGSSYSGGHAIALAADRELDVKAAISQCPWTGTAGPQTLTTTLVLVGAALIDDLKQAMGLAPFYHPSAGPYSMLSTPGCIEGLTSLQSEPGAWANEMTASSLHSIMKNKPSAHAANIRCPLVLIAPRKDDICLYEGALQVAAQSDKVEFITTPGGHFDVYPGQENHEQSVGAMLEFLKKHVPV